MVLEKETKEKEYFKIEFDGLQKRFSLQMLNYNNNLSRDLNNIMHLVSFTLKASNKFNKIHLFLCCF